MYELQIQLPLRLGMGHPGGPALYAPGGAGGRVTTGEREVRSTNRKSDFIFIVLLHIFWLLCQLHSRGSSTGSS